MTGDWSAACDRLEHAGTAAFEAALGRARRVPVAAPVAAPVAEEPARLVVVPPVARAVAAPVAAPARRRPRLASFVGSAACVAGLALVGAGLADLRRPPEVGASVPLVEVRVESAERERPPRPPVASARAAARPARPPVRPVVPERLAVPDAHVDTTLERLHIDARGELGVPRRYGRAGWWAGGPRPGEVGAAVFVGHVDSTSGPAVFYELPRLRPGDEVVVTGADGSVLRFAVYRVDRYPKNRFPTGWVYGRTAGPELRLITCGGAFDERTRHYVDNVVVYAAAVS